MDKPDGRTVAEHRDLVRAKRFGAGLSIIVFPLLLLLGFVAHPNLLSFAMISGVDAWIAEWRGNDLFHFGHLLVLFAVPFIIFATVRFISVAQGRGGWFCLIGGVLGVFGAFMLAVDKGALTLVLTAFQTVPDNQFANTRPALQAVFSRAGWLWITWAYVALPFGVILQIIGMLKERIIPEWQGYTIIAGLLLLLNPDIEIISAAGAFLMCVGFVPLGLRELSGRL
jgi:hypothetical protein